MALKLTDLSELGNINVTNNGSGNSTITLKSTTGGDPTIVFNSAAANRSGVLNFQDNGTQSGQIVYNHNGDHMRFYTGGASSAGHLELALNESAGAIFRTQVQATNYFDKDNTAYYVNPAGTSRMNDIELDDYIYHKDDTHTYFGFTGNDAFAMVFEGTTRLSVADSADPVFSYNAHINMNNKDIDYVNQLHFGSNVRFYDEGNDNYLNFKFGDADWGGIKMIDGNGNLHGYFYADGDDSIGILDNDGSWAVQVDGDVLTALKVNDVYRVKATMSGVELSGATTVAGNITANQFVDAQDTAFYANPAATSILRRTVGTRRNLATSEAWSETNAWSVGTQTGYFGGSFTINGSSDENNIAYEIGPGSTHASGHGNRCLVWKITTNNASDSGADGGWNKTITNINPNMGHMSVIYVKRVASGNGNFYHGTSTCLNISDGSSNGNPYFTSGASQSLPSGVWCVSIGYLQAANDTAVTSSSSFSGIYRLDTGERIIGNTDYRMSGGTTTTQHRTFLYYSTNTDTELWLAKPGFYEINGNEPTINELLMRPEDRVDSLRADNDMRAPIYYDSNDTNYYVNPATGSVLKGTVTVHTDSDSALSVVDGGTNAIGIYAHASDELYLGSNNASKLRIHGGGAIESYADFRAPLFYDSNNTNYYLHGDAKSNLHSISFDGALSGTVSGAAEIGRNHAYDTVELKGYGAELMIGAQNAGIHINYRTCNNGASGHTPTTWYWRAGSATNWSAHNFGNVTSNGILTATTDVRAPLYYDSSDTTYYTNPAGDSIMNQIHLADYIRHLGDLDTYIGFPSADNFLIHTGGTDAVAVSSAGNLTAYGDVRTPLVYDSNNTSYYIDPAHASTSLATTGKWFMQGSHSSARFQLNYQHSATDSANSGTLTGWASEPGITYSGSGIGGNVNVSGQYYGRQYNSGYGVYVRFDKAGGTLSHWTTTGTAGTAGGQGTQQWYNDASGNSFSTTSCRAPIFYDSNDTGYYTNPASTSNMNTIGAAVVNTTALTATGTATFNGGNNYFNPDSDSQLWIGNAGTDALAIYGGSGDTVYIGGNNTWQLYLTTNNYVYTRTWINLGSGAGIFSTTNSAHLYPNGNYTYGTWRVDGARNGYTGHVFSGGAGTVSGMFDSNGNGGDYNHTSGWHFYYHRSNDCLGVADSVTASSYGLYVTGAIYSTADVVAYSDRRAKENIVTVDNALDKVSELRGVYYNKKDSDDDKRQVGVIAQEVKEVLPEVVTYDKDNDQYGVDYGKINGLLIEAIKDLKKEVEFLKKQLNK